MEQKIIILFANPWSLTDERTGKQRSGVSIQYMMGDKLTPVNDPNGSSGYQVIKESIPSEMINSLRAVPGVYDATIGLQPRGGKTVAVVKSVKFVEAFE